jgi:RNA polymerase sigma-70 factor (ECF subfamily)
MDDRTSIAKKDDAELILMSKSGDLEAYGEVYRRYLAPIYRFIRLRVSTDRDAEDLTEQVFLKAFEALDTYKERGVPYSAYLYQVARNLVVDTYRAQPPVESMSDLEAIAGSSSGSEQEIINRQSLEEIKQALERLPEHYQEVIHLRVIMGMQTKQAAAWMDRKPANVRVLLHRALKSLREELGALHG